MALFLDSCKSFSWVPFRIVVIISPGFPTEISLSIPSEIPPGDLAQNPPGVHIEILR